MIEVYNGAFNGIWMHIWVFIIQINFIFLKREFHFKSYYWSVIYKSAQYLH